MLLIVIPEIELWDEQKEEFIRTKAHKLALEHSLLSISKWESKWCKPFLLKEPKTAEQDIDYIKCMTITQNVDPKVYNYLTNENFQEINKYIEAPMSASTVSDMPGGTSREMVTSELIYYWMVSLNIPFECQKWHLNRLLMLIKICNAKNKPSKHYNKRDLYRQHSKINSINRKRFNSKG